MRVLVTGAGGLLGGRLAELLHGRGLEVLAAHRLSIPPPGPRPVLVELTDEEALARLLDASRPDAVVHAAVLGRSNQCEERPDEAERVNARLPGTLARECRERGLRLVALSTDLVFGGDRAFVREDDPPGPLGVYGRTKLAGEEAVLSACPGAAVVRVALILGRGHGARATSTESVARALLRRPGRRGSSRTSTARRWTRSRWPTPSPASSTCPAAGRFHLGGPERDQPLRARPAGRPLARPAGRRHRRRPASGSRGAGPPRRRRLARLRAGPARAGLGAPADRRGDPGKPRGRPDQASSRRASGAGRSGPAGRASARPRP